MKQIRPPVYPPLLPVVLSLITGILTGSFHPDLPVGIFAACALVLVIALLFFLLRLNVLVTGISFLVMVWGFFSISGVLCPEIARDSVASYADSSHYTITGKIVSFSKEYPRKNRVILLCSMLEKKGKAPARVNGRILLSVYDKNRIGFQYGDLIEFTSRLNPIRNFSNPNGFDYERHMKFNQISGSAAASSDRIQVLSCPMDFHTRIIRGLEQVRNRFFYFIMEKMDNRDAGSVLAALITGKKEAVSLNIMDAFSKAGASHILAISGLHLSIVALGFFFVFYGLFALVPAFLITGAARKAAGILTLVPLFFYGSFSGFSPSTQRAFIMTAIFMVSFVCERENNPLNTLALAAIVILLIDTSSLFSISFQLSFAALLFIIVGFSLVNARGWMPTKKIRAIVFGAGLVTFFAGLGTVPLIAHYFNLVSFVQMLSNLLLVPLMGFVCLPLGFLILLAIPLSPVLAEIMTRVCQHILGFCLGYIEFLVKFEYSWARIVGIDTMAVILVYLFLAALGVYLFRQRKTDLVFLAAVVLAGIVFFGSGLKTKLFPEKMRITILDVGQGSSALIQTVEGKNILVDGGGFSDNSSFDVGRYVVGPFLWSEKILTLDAVILTHPEADHMNGLLYVLENFKVPLLVKNKEEGSSNIYKKIMALCHGKNIRIWTPCPGNSTLDFKRTYLIFYPDFLPTVGHDPNNNSLVFQIRFKQFSMLFSGDILTQRETALARQKESISARVLVAPHHGSLTSNNKIFLDKVNPESVIISCGHGNRYGFPHPYVLKRYESRGSTVFRTDLHGAVTISSDGIDYNILTHKGG